MVYYKSKKQREQQRRLIVYLRTAWALFFIYISLIWYPVVDIFSLIYHLPYFCLDRVDGENKIVYSK